MILPLRTSLPVIAAAVLAACASPSPRYQTAYRYELPTDSEGLVCLEKCGQKIEACQQRCTANYQSCLKLIEPQADGRYGEALKRYEADLDRYRGELERYQLYLSMSWNRPPWYGYGYYPAWPDPHYFPPEPPGKPVRDEEVNRLRQEKCEVDCGCQTVSDACFLACGGRRTSGVRCVANCPDVK
ncbi:MAG: hypothetical protein EPN14_09055 [Gallionella sp.]|nr:MAG: hypothetical protein EPN14_09055 [Gallionella sp.]